MTFAQRVGVGGATFRQNLHLGRTKVTDVVSEITGMPTGRIVDHGDGRRDAHHVQDTCITLTAEQVHGSYREGRRWLYDNLRSQGFTHAEAMRRMTREHNDRKVM